MYISLVPRPSASRARIAFVTFEPLSDNDVGVVPGLLPAIWQGFKGHECDAHTTGRRPGNEAKCTSLSWRIPSLVLLSCFVLGLKPIKNRIWKQLHLVLYLVLSDTTPYSLKQFSVRLLQRQKAPTPLCLTPATISPPHSYLRL